MTAKPTKDSAPRKSGKQTAALDTDGPPLSDADREGMRRVAPVKDLRWKLNMSQQDFASAYGIPLQTLRAWERREAEPSPAELAYIRLIERDPVHARLVTS